MTEYRIRILPTASQDLARLDKSIGSRIVQRINWLAAHLDAIFMKYWSEETIVIHAIGHRREIYRKR